MSSWVEDMTRFSPFLQAISTTPLEEVAKRIPQYTKALLPELDFAYLMLARGIFMANGPPKTILRVFSNIWNRCGRIALNSRASKSVTPNITRAASLSCDRRTTPRTSVSNKTPPSISFSQRSYLGLSSYIRFLYLSYLRVDVDSTILTPLRILIQYPKTAIALTL